MNNNLKAKAAMAAVAAQEGISRSEVERSIQDAIDAAWNDPEARLMQQILFPSGKPTPAQFITKLTSIAKKEPA